MPTSLKRDELDRIAAFYSLSPAQTDQMLDLAGARPSRAEGLTFVARCLHYAGILSLACALVFFVAANWSRITIFGRFALLEIVLVAFVCVALWKPPPRVVGRSALFLAFITTGTLLALFGQTYQTGADVYELFLIWSLSGLPFVVAAQWGVTSAAWVLVLNTALLLFCGWRPSGGLLMMLFSGRRLGVLDALLTATYVNLGAWLVFEKLRHPAVPDWVRRILLFCALGFATWIGVALVTDFGYDYDRAGNAALAAVGVVIAMLIAAGWALRQRRDVYPLALVMTSFVIIVLCWIPKLSRGGGDEAVIFLMALWLIGSSTVGGRMLMLMQRQWRAAAA